MKHFISGLTLLLFLCGLRFPVEAQKIKYAKAKILFSDGHDMKRLASLGVECDHGDYKAGHYFISGFSEKEIQRIQADGFGVEILVPDVVKDFQERNAKVQPNAIQADNFPDYCNKAKNRKVPKNWKLGTMGGHLTYEEMLLHLDSMKIKYPNLITSKAAIDTTKTIEGRHIQFVKISDNPGVSEPAEPQALFSAVHHAREPVGMHQLIFFMWYLLENYATDQEVKALVDNSEIYFVPCVNPDGYVFNQNDEPTGGGMWRKNRRNNGDGTMGVDLNRNYGHNWGYNDFGSSPNSEAETYRGTAGFSEPETRAMKKFTETHAFKIGLNYHTYANLVIHPWGYENVQTPDSILFRTLTKEMIRENNYRIGTCLEVLNYTSNGSSDDFMYSTQPGKPKIYAMTPEIGDWFWPTQDEILPLCVENVHQNLTVIRSLHPLLGFRDTTGLFLRTGLSPQTASEPRLLYRLTKSMVNQTATNFTVTLKPLAPNPGNVQPVTRVYTSAQVTPARLDSVVFSTLPDLPLGTRISWEVAVSNGVFQVRDTIWHSADYPHSDAVLERVDCDNLTNWVGDFVVANTGQQQGAGCITDSDGDYQPDDDKYIQRVRPFDLRGANSANSFYEMTFWTKFAIEKNYDYAEIQLSTDSTTWETVCTDFTVFSSPFSQQTGFGNVVPIWDGFLNKWRKEMLDLTPYKGKKVWIRFHFNADAGSEFDGFYFDNIVVRKSALITATARTLGSESLEFNVYPNPGSGQVTFTVNQPDLDSKIQVINSLGKRVAGKHLNGSSALEWKLNLPAGAYTAVFTNAQGLCIKQRLIVR